MIEAPHQSFCEMKTRLVQQMSLVQEAFQRPLVLNGTQEMCG